MTYSNMAIATIIASDVLIIRHGKCRFDQLISKKTIKNMGFDHIYTSYMSVRNKKCKKT